MRLIKIVFLFAVLVLGWLIGWSNNEPVALSFMDWQTLELPVYVFYSIFLSLGILVGLLLGRLIQRR